jgi:phosphate transport system substrate-binding protein
MFAKALRRYALGLVVVSLLAACGSSTVSAPEPAPVSAAAPGELPAIDPATIDGDVTITGSSTVYPLTATMAEAFAAEGGRAEISVQSTGTGGGFRRFCEDENTIDIVNASRPATAEEEQLCVADNRPLVGFRVGTDALAVVVNPQNTFVTELTKEQLAQIFSGAVTTWAEVDASYPAEPISLFSPGTDSGTFDYFVEEVFEGDENRISPNALLSENDTLLVEGVANNPYAIAYFGYAYFQENSTTLRAVPVDGGSGPVTPSEATVGDNSYPLARPLFIYSSPRILREHPEVAAFINYYLVHVNDEIVNVGYFPANEADLEAARQTLLSATQPS